MAAVERQKLAYQKIQADALVKAEEAARVRREKISQKIQALKNSVKATHSERDKARAVIKAKEARWHEVGSKILREDSWFTKSLRHFLLIHTNNRFFFFLDISFDRATRQLSRG